MSRNNWIWVIIFILILGSIGAVLLNRFGIPFLSTIPGLNWVQKFESSNPVVINRYQEVQFNEGANLVDLSKQAAGYTVSIYSTGTNPKFLGNGIITSADGMILSSKSNLPASGNVTVVLNDGTNTPGQIRALDPKSEIAVITVSGQNLPFAQFANASDLQASQRVIFIGRSNNAFVHNFSIGQVSQPVSNDSSLDQVFDSETFQNSIATDAKIDPNFVGGPIIDLDGKVIGMTRGDLGVLIGENLQTAVSSFLATGKIVRPSLGVKYLNLTDSLAKLKGLPQGGALVTNIDANSAAQKGGLAVNDLIISIDNQNLPAANFEKVLNQHSISAIPMTVLRGGNKIDLTINLQPK